jgi:hypothetical protein
MIEILAVTTKKRTRLLARPVSGVSDVLCLRRYDRPLQA